MMHTLILKEGVFDDIRMTTKKCLIAFYSLTGTTRTVAQQIAMACHCDMEEIVDMHSRAGVFGYLKSGYQAMTKKSSAIKPALKNPAHYELVILGTPVWAGNISAPMRSYIAQNNGSFKQIATFCTMGGSGSDKVLEDMEALCGKHAVAQLALTEQQVRSNQYLDQVAGYAVSVAAHRR